LGEAAFLTAKAVTEAGAFLDWGIDKDIFVPFKEQTMPIEEGEQYVIVLYWDEKSSRLAGSARLGRHLNNAGHDLEEGQKVNLLFGDKSDMGYNVVIDKKYLGLVYHNEVFQNVHYGEQTTGYIKAIRQNNKIDVSLQKSGFESILDGVDVVLTALEKSRGFLPLNDDSNPEDIKNRLGISKKLFKKSLSKLYRQRVITLHEDGIRLTDLE
jgi:predicted RNA-binding protein (virulence factor B family)